MGSWLRGSINVRLIALGILGLLLLIPSSFVGSLIQERQSRRGEAIEEVGGKWGREQTVAGPVLHVPYRRLWKDEKGETRSRGELATFLPATLDVTGSVTTEVRRRGIYEVVLYRAALRFSGHFGPTLLDDRSINADDVLWDEAFVTVGIADMRGIEKRVTLTWNGERLDFLPGLAGSPLSSSGIHSRVKVASGPSASGIPFSFEMSIRGHDALTFVPIASHTSVNLRSPWPHPSFVGSFLPQDHSVSATGFEAQWNILDLNRGFPQQWTGPGQTIQGFDFGVKFIYPVDSYQKSDRAHKYAILIIAMTFIALFFIEILKNERVNVLNYILIGLAICLFYAILLSLSEHVGFDLAYGIATLATTTLTTWHASNILVQRRLCRAVGSVLLVLYTFMYFLLQLQDFALLFGSLGLFVMLAALMAASSRIKPHGAENG